MSNGLRTGVVLTALLALGGNAMSNPDRYNCDLSCITHRPKRQLNCPNCGAPITGKQCEYCKTMFDLEEE